MSEDQVWDPETGALGEQSNSQEKPRAGEYTFQVWQPDPGEKHHGVLTEIRAVLDNNIIGRIKLVEGRMQGILDIAYIQVVRKHQRKGIATELHIRALAFADAKSLRLRSVNPLNPRFTKVWDRLQANRREAEGGDIKTGAASEG